MERSYTNPNAELLSLTMPAAWFCRALTVLLTNAAPKCRVLSSTSAL